MVLNVPGDRLSILDIPAGNGMVSDYLRKHGHVVTSADFNSERPDYAYVNMEEALPFQNASFDVVMCLEGIEHVIEPSSLISEMCRVVKPGGTIIVSMPNVQSLHSRLEFLFTGTLYQFDPRYTHHPRGQPIDRGHISPISLVQLHYLFEENNTSLIEATGDKIKRKILMPFYLFLWFINIFMTKIRMRDLSPTNDQNHLNVLYKFMIKMRPMMSRTLVTRWNKRA